MTQLVIICNINQKPNNFLYILQKKADQSKMKKRQLKILKR